MVVKRFIEKCRERLPGRKVSDCYFLTSGEAAQIRCQCPVCGAAQSLVIGESFDSKATWWFCKRDCSPEQIWLQMQCHGLSEDDLFHRDRVRYLNELLKLPAHEGAK